MDSQCAMQCGQRLGRHASPPPIMHTLARVTELSRDTHCATSSINDIPRQGGKIVRVFHRSLVNGALTRIKSHYLLRGTIRCDLR